ncbi:carbohydrate porin, partial [Klebsiella pneumoniae]|nr:carbohydrate porin [Klebsiella pneumoniae]
KEHRNYLAAGGYGFIIGDGALNYATEDIGEAFYAFSIPKAYLTLTADYQFCLHPAYNKSNGSVHILALRMHFAF